MKRSLLSCIILISASLSLKAQSAYLPVVDKISADHWSEIFSPVDDLNDLINIIYREEDKSGFISNIPTGYPLHAEVSVNSHYGVRKHPVHKTVKFHKGTDLEGNFGDKVFATADGKVIVTGYEEALGNYVKIQHKYGFETIYGHLQSISVRRGAVVKKNTLLGKVGASGTVTGPHLHYTLKKNGHYLDPFEFMYMDFDKTELN